MAKSHAMPIRPSLVILAGAVLTGASAYLLAEPMAPGFIEGDWLQQGLGEAYESVRSAKTAGAVLGKVATPDDIASGILAMIQATHTTGHILPLDGGDTLGPRIVSGLK